MVSSQCVDRKQQEIWRWSGFCAGRCQQNEDPPAASKPYCKGHPFLDPEGSDEQATRGSARLGSALWVSIDSTRVLDGAACSPRAITIKRATSDTAERRIVGINISSALAKTRHPSERNQGEDYSGYREDPNAS
jgi:hypothetical protein